MRIFSLLPEKTAGFFNLPWQGMEKNVLTPKGT
jgi:hypothetical protein